MSIGDELAQARHRAGLTVVQVSEQTRIRESIIRGIEQDDYAACGGDFYVRGHIRAIARAVGADPVPLIQEYDTIAGHLPGADDTLPGTTGGVRLTRQSPPWSPAAKPDTPPQARTPQPPPPRDYGALREEPSGLDALFGERDEPEPVPPAPVDARPAPLDERNFRLFGDWPDSRAASDQSDYRAESDRRRFGAARADRGYPDRAEREYPGRGEPGYSGRGEREYPGRGAYPGRADGGGHEDRGDYGTDPGAQTDPRGFKPVSSAGSGTSERLGPGAGFGVAAGAAAAAGYEAARGSGPGGQAPTAAAPPGAPRAGAVPGATRPMAPPPPRTRPGSTPPGGPGAGALPRGGPGAGTLTPRSKRAGATAPPGTARPGATPAGAARAGGTAAPGAARPGGIPPGTSRAGAAAAPGAARPGGPRAGAGRAGAAGAGDEERRRNPTALIAVIVVLAVVGFGVYLLTSGSGSTPRASSGSTPRAGATAGASRPAHHKTGSGHPRATSSPSATASTTSQTLTPASASAFGPSGAGAGDNAAQAPLAIDSSSATDWETDWYKSATFGGLQTGTGLLLDMGHTVTITSAEITLGSTAGAGFQLRAGSSPVLADLSPVATATDAAGTVRLHLSSPAHARYLLIWFTSLPPDTSGTYQAQVYNVSLQGTG